MLPCANQSPSLEICACVYPGTRRQVVVVRAEEGGSGAAALRQRFLASWLCSALLSYQPRVARQTAARAAARRGGSDLTLAWILIAIIGTPKPRKSSDAFKSGSGDAEWAFLPVVLGLWLAHTHFSRSEKDLALLDTDNAKGWLAALKYTMSRLTFGYAAVLSPHRPLTASQVGTRRLSYSRRDCG